MGGSICFIKVCRTVLSTTSIKEGLHENQKSSYYLKYLLQLLMVDYASLLSLHCAPQDAAQIAEEAILLAEDLALEGTVCTCLNVWL